MTFLSILLFVGKVFLIDVLVFALSKLVSAVWHNAWPTLYELQQAVPEHSNRYISWCINGLEIVIVSILVYWGYSIPLITVSTFVLISIVGYVARKFLH